MQLVAGLIIGDRHSGLYVADAAPAAAVGVRGDTAGDGRIALSVLGAVQNGTSWVSVAFYLWGILAGSLLISQFWTLANDVYDPARRSGCSDSSAEAPASEGSWGRGSPAVMREPIGTNNLLLVAAVFLAVCAAIVSMICVRERPEGTDVAGSRRERSQRRRKRSSCSCRPSTCRSLRSSSASRRSAPAIIEQQLNMAAEQAKGPRRRISMTAFLGHVGLDSSIAGFVIQIWLT